MNEFVLTQRCMSMTLRKSLVIVLWSLLITDLPRDLPAEDYRVWRDQTGKFSVDARLLDHSDSEVTLHTRDNRKITVRLDRLSEDDQKFVAGMSSQTPQQKIDFDADKPVDLGITDSWQLDVQPVKTEAPSNEKMVAFGEPVAALERFSLSVVNPRAGRALISSTYATARSREPMSRLQILDYTSGVIVNDDPNLPGSWQPVALDDSGTRAILLDVTRELTDEGRTVLAHFDGQNWNLDEPWQPFADIADLTYEELLAELEARKETMSRREKSEYEALLRSNSDFSRQAWLRRLGPPPGRSVEFATFVTGDRLVTINARGSIRLWEVGSLKLLAQYDFPGPCSATLSPDGRHLAVAGPGLAAVIDTQQVGRTAGRSFQARQSEVRIAFSPSGERIAFSPNNYVIVLDAASGETIHEGSLQGVGVNRMIAFAGEELLLVDHHFLYDYRSQTFAWAYNVLGQRT